MALQTAVRGRGEGATAADGGSLLDLHEGISDPSAGCDRWPAKLRLVGSGGQRVKGRCRATNLCAYCRTLYTVETVEMLTLDALEHSPTLWMVLTAREHLTRADTYQHLAQLRTAGRRRWPAMEWFVQVEFQRRGALHLNLLVKGVPASAGECNGWRGWDGRRDPAPDCGNCLRCVLSSRWCSRVDAEPVGQWVGAVADGVGVVRYIAKMVSHGMKQEQAPPIGWKGHRTSQTRGYLVRPAWKMRREARESLQLKRELWKAEQAGLGGVAAYDQAVAAVEAAASVEWRLGVLTVDSETGELTGVRPATGPGDLDHVWRTRIRDLRHDTFLASAEWAAKPRHAPVPRYVDLSPRQLAFVLTGVRHTRE